MDPKTKFLLKLSAKNRATLLIIFEKIRVLDLDGLDVKRLQWEADLFRVRMGKIRIIFKKGKEMGTLVNVDYRDKIYKRL